MQSDAVPNSGLQGDRAALYNVRMMGKDGAVFTGTKRVYCRDVSPPVPLNPRERPIVVGSVLSS